MFNLTGLLSEGNSHQSERYFSSVDLAMNLCESVPGQFKLIETPINSFVMVTNVMPEDTRPWNTHNPQGLDFSGIHLPRLKKLNDFVHWPHTEQNITGDPIIEDKEPPCHYLVYSSRSWLRALQMNKQSLIKDAIEKLAEPVTWKGLVTEDPLPLIWLLFYGQKSFCSSHECLYFKRFGFKGPILFPPHIYSPDEDVLSFICSVCKYVKFLYGEQFKEEMIHNCETPFDRERLVNAMLKLKFISDGGTYISQTCLLCSLYKQNLTSACAIDNLHGCLILGGSGKKYLAGQIKTKRCLDLGDSILFPSYNLTSLIDDLDPNGLF
ncbi:hypothetical protein KM481_gp29 [Harp seal herpesvirus]|uniref:Protein UL95 n=1 Tax=phocid gammaherpesvirus 3 TaxID=2560643 RepID=A0A0R5WUP8_9GAMA|nr:hypothetical protein KM481_gp29 [Harp seal herpesvirus]AJG42959.1 hypothetical protein [Harp seal herpesvirus]